MPYLADAPRIPPADTTASSARSGGPKRLARLRRVTVRHTNPMHAESPTGGAGALEISRADDRFVTERPGITTFHCFSFGEHYDPDRVGIRSLIAFVDERNAPGYGYELHAHRDLEFVTYALAGTLLHEDSMGGRAKLHTGDVQRFTAGTGVQHSELNSQAADGTLRFIQ